MTGRRYASTYERLVANTAEPENDRACWIWRGPTRRHGGGDRPAISLRVPGVKHPRQHHACRVMLGLTYELDDDAEASHLCENWLCIHPDHLIPETRAQNMARRWGKPVPPGREWKRRDTDAGVPDLDVRWAPAMRPLTVCPF